MSTTVLEKIVSMGCMCFHLTKLARCADEHESSKDDDGVSLKYFKEHPQAIRICSLVVGVNATLSLFFLSFFFFLGFTIVHKQHKI